jgi:endonuclease/exonuclease/phosphatase (EEP) superfamily protein YafD
MSLILNLAGLFLRGTALMFGLVGAVAGLACWGGLFSDRLDALTHAAPIWLCCALAGLVLALAFSRNSERRALAGIATVGVAALLALMAPELLSTPRAPERPSAGAATLKLVQFNLWAENRDPGDTAAWLVAQNADIVITEESGARAMPIVRALKKTYPYSSACPSLGGCDTRIFSRWPIVRNDHFVGYAERVTGAWATVRHPHGNFTVVGSHFSWPYPVGTWRRQSRLLTAGVAAFPKDSLIIAGDFNSTPWSWSLRRQDKALGLERRTRALASWPTGDFSRVASAPFPVLPIDHVYAGKAWKTVKVERGPSLGSDHRPVVVTLAR